VTGCARTSTTRSPTTAGRCSTAWDSRWPKRPGEWLALDRARRPRELAKALRATTAATGEFATVVDLTHGRALLRLTGRDAATVLAGVCAIDLADTVTPDGTALRTSLAAVVTDIVRDDQTGVRSYLLHVDRSSGQYLAEALLDAGSPLGLELTGPELDRV